MNPSETSFNSSTPPFKVVASGITSITIPSGQVIANGALTSWTARIHTSTGAICPALVFQVITGDPTIAATTFTGSGPSIDMTDGIGYGSLATYEATTSYTDAKIFFQNSFGSSLTTVGETINLRYFVFEA